MSSFVYEQIRQHKVNRDHELRLRAAENALSASATSNLELVGQVAQAVTAIIDRLVEKGLLSAEEADGLRAMIPPIPQPAPSPAEALAEMGSDGSSPIADPSIADTQAAALVALSDAVQAEESQAIQDEPTADPAKEL